MSRPGHGTKALTPRQKLERDKKWFNDAHRIASHDPGVDPLINIAIHDQQAMDDLLAGKLDNKKHQTVQVSQKQWREMNGQASRLARMNKWLDKAPEDVKAFNRGTATRKTARLDRTLECVGHALAYVVPVVDFHCKPRIRHLRWYTHMQTQQAYDKLANMIKGGKRKSKTLLVYGAAQFSSTGRGRATVPTTTLKRKLAQRVRLVEQEEFRTSMLSPCCHVRMKTVVKGQRDAWRAHVCSKDGCVRAIWERNVAAAINILYKFLCRMREVDLSPTFELGKVRNVDKVKRRRNQRQVVG